MIFNKIKSVLRSYFEGGCGNYEIGPYEESPPPGAWPDQRDCVLFREEVKESIRKIRAIIQCKNEQGEGLEGGYAALVQARATSNQRLVTVFGIDNAFTTYDAERKRNFVVEVNNRVKNVSDEAWQELANEAAYWAMLKINTVKRLDLTEFVQFLTMKVSLHFLFAPIAGFLSSKEAEESIAFIAKEINRLWLASKVTPITEKWEEQSRFHEALHRVTGSGTEKITEDPHFSDPKENPLNWILPAYESMWRIVLTTVRQVYFRSDDKQDNTDAMKRFLKKPCRKTFRNEDNVCGISPHHLIKECLRLYPPVRQIGRTLPQNGKTKLIKADIHECQRNDLLAEFAPNEFRPGRWKHIEAQHRSNGGSKNLGDFEEELGFLPFGSAPFKCPAGKGNFAFRMIGILVGATLTCFDTGYWQEEPESGNCSDEIGSGREEGHALLYESSYG